MTGNALFDFFNRLIRLDVDSVINTIQAAVIVGFPGALLAVMIKKSRQDDEQAVVYKLVSLSVVCFFIVLFIYNFLWILTKRTIEKTGANLYQISNINLVYDLWMKSFVSILLVFFVYLVIAFFGSWKKNELPSTVVILMLSCSVYLSVTAYLYFCQYEFSRDVIVGFEIIGQDASKIKIIDSELEIHWTPAENAVKYSVYAVNQSKQERLAGRTNQASAVIKASKLARGEINDVYVEAAAYACMPKSTEPVRVYALPKKLSLALDKAAVGQEISPTIPNAEEAHRNLVFEESSIQWYRDGEPIQGATLLAYGLSPEDYGSKIHVQLEIAGRQVSSNTISPQLGEFQLFYIYEESLSRDSIYIFWDDIENADWYDVCLDGEIVMTVKQNFSIVQISPENEKIQVVARGLGYKDRQSYDFTIDSHKLEP